DGRWQAFSPLTLTRPVWDLRVGMLTIFEKWRYGFSDEVLRVYSPRETVTRVFLEQVRGAHPEILDHVGVMVLMPPMSLVSRMGFVRAVGLMLFRMGMPRSMCCMPRRRL
ncbi:MAG: hypothetical protein L3J76_06090, partial [Candidatus Hydrothermae bacterium]|nr:hypothetical protein [Candidatus Hydrothermae bacterium]